MRAVRLVQAPIPSPIRRRFFSFGFAAVFRLMRAGQKEPGTGTVFSWERFFGAFRGPIKQTARTLADQEGICFVLADSFARLVVENCKCK